MVDYADCNHARNSLSHFERNVVGGLTSFKMCSNGVLEMVRRRRPFCFHLTLRVGSCDKHQPEYNLSPCFRNLNWWEHV